MNAAGLRNQAVRAAREFFAAHGIREVMTPKAVPSPALEPYIDAVELRAQNLHEPLYLATSPEFALKKIFASEMAAPGAGRGIYEIARVFRDDAAGKNHALEFTMLEWYTAGTALPEILQAAAELMAFITRDHPFPAVAQPLEILDLRDLFAGAGCAFDFGEEQSVIDQYQRTYGTIPEHLNQTDAAIACFNLLFDERVLPLLRARSSPVAVKTYPAYLGALAYTDHGIAERAEIFWCGVEIANGYREEFRPDKAKYTWNKYNEIRERRRVPAHAMDDILMQHLPSLEGVAGIAAGLERILSAANPAVAIRDFCR